MSFSSMTLEYRDKQDQFQKYFLIYSLIASLALHVGVLAFGLGNLLISFPKVEDEPIEVTIIDEPTPKITKPPEEKKKPPQKVDSGGGGGGGNGVATQTPARKETPSVPIAKQLPIKTAPVPVFKQPPIKTAPLEKLVDNFKTPPPEPPQPVATVKPQITPEAIPSPDPVTKPSTPLIPTPTPVASPTQKLVDNFKTPPPQSPQVSSGTGVSNRRQRTMLADSPRNDVGNGSGNGVGNGVGSSSGNGTGNGVGNGSGNGTGNGKLEGERIATAPKLPKPPTLKPKSTRLNLAKDCVIKNCGLKYPERALRLGIEGNPEVTIDYDENGNVTNVQLTRPSGKAELDEGFVEQVRNFKLKPTPGGRKGVRLVGNFLKSKDSELAREYEARQRKREAQAREAEIKQRDTLTNTPNENPNGSQQSTAGVITDVPGQTTSNRRRRSLTPSSQQTPATNPAQEVPSQRVQSNSGNQSVPFDTQTPSAESGNRRPRKLENVLPSQQPSEPSPDSSLKSGNPP